MVANGQMAKKAKLNPEIICLSDDDDDHGDNNNNSKSNIPISTSIKLQESPTIVNNDNNKSNIPIVPLIKPQESPTIVNNNKAEIPIPAVIKAQESSTTVNNNDSSAWTIDPKDIIHIPDLPTRYSDIFKKPFEIRCSTIHFGIVQFNVATEVIRMEPTEFQMDLSGGFLEHINMKLAYSDIITFYFSFQSQIPTALILVRDEFARLFDKYIPTSDDQGRGFDPKSKDERRRRIILQLKSLTPDMEKIHTSTIYHFLKTKSPKMDICCIDGKRAEELYNLARYAKVLLPGSKQTPFFLTTNDLTAKTVGLNNKQIRFDLTYDDLRCLNEDEFLNDNIIDFYLQYIYYEKLSEEDRKRTYLFNSFFYRRLTQKGNKENTDISAAERRYNRVKRWLRHVDLFSKDYLIVPINQNAHWYTLIVQNPNNVPTEADLISEDDDFDDNLKSKKKRRSTKLNPRSTRNSSIIKPKIDPIDIIDDADEVGSDDELPLKINIESFVNSKQRSKCPAIIIFDSLRTASKTRVAATFREFLQLEYDHKKTITFGSLERKLFNKDTISTIEAAVPQQNNYSDCGLYVLQYIESFFAHRSLKLNLQISSTYSDWFDKSLMGNAKRKEILNVINQHVIPKEE